MKTLIVATRQFFAQIWDDAMLAALLLVPLLMGLAFRFGVPALESFLSARLQRAALLTPYYPLFDLLLSAMTPIMFSAAGALVVLDEADNGLGRALVVSPLGRRGYIASRIIIPSLLGTIYCLLVTALFRLSALSYGRLALLALCSGALGVMVALLIPALAKNRVEGMAVSKLSGLIMLGLPAALLLPAPLKYAAAPLPSLWMTELVMGGSPANALAALLSAAVLSLILASRFIRRVL